MANAYMDRGIIKWAPFDALIGYQSLLNDLKNKLAQREQPVLSDDDYMTLNLNLSMALNEQAFIEIHYFKKGFIHTTQGYITKICPIYKKITLSKTLTLKAEDILMLEIL